MWTNHFHDLYVSCIRALASITNDDEDERIYRYIHDFTCEVRTMRLPHIIYKWLYGYCLTRYRSAIYWDREFIFNRITAAGCCEYTRICGKRTATRFSVQFTDVNALQLARRVCVFFFFLSTVPPYRLSQQPIHANQSAIPCSPRAISVDFSYSLPPGA